jgi:hypothetical protein
MEYSQYIEECSKMLSERSQVPTDKALVYHIRLQRLTEEVSAQFGLLDMDVSQPIEEARLKLMIQIFGTQIQDLRENIPQDVFENGKAIFPEQEIKHRPAFCCRVLFILHPSDQSTWDRATESS